MPNYPNIGQQYQFIQEIGRGGTGVVNLAIDLYSGYPVAIKSLFPNISDSMPEMKEKTRIEANLYLMLSHPNIVKLKDFILKNGAHIVMEYIDGQTLDNYINTVTGPIPTEVTVAMMKDIVSAIGYAHKKKIAIKGYHGVLHLDIKPGNILISKSGNIKIIDYGISQGTKQERSEKIMGSPMYMAPEQLDLDCELTAKTDIYSLGVLLYQMATGRLPYDKKLTQEEIFDNIRKNALDKINLIYPHADERLQKIIDRATKKEPKDRYSSCDEMLTDLEKIK